MNASLGVSVISSLNLSNLNETEKNPIVPLNTFTMEAQELVSPPQFIVVLSATSVLQWHLRNYVNISHFCNRSLCSAAQELTAEELVCLLPTSTQGMETCISLSF